MSFKITKKMLIFNWFLKVLLPKHYWRRISERFMRLAWSVRFVMNRWARRKSWKRIWRLMESLSAWFAIKTSSDRINWNFIREIMRKLTHRWELSATSAQKHSIRRDFDRMCSDFIRKNMICGVKEFKAEIMRFLRSKLKLTLGERIDRK